jgi:hypothetical protein
MGADVINTVGAMLEQVDPICRDIFETSDQVSARIKKNSKTITNLSRYLYRIPLKMYRGGVHGKYSANGGTMPTGSGMKLTSLQAGYIYTITMFQVTDEQVDLSQNTKQSVIDVMSQTLADGMMEAAVADDQWLHTDGTGELTNGCDTPATTTTTATMTFNAATDTLGVSRLREGMAVEVWDSTGATKRAPTAGANTPLKIETIDYSTNTVVFDGTVVGMTAGDMITFYNLDVYGPATLTSFSAGWPATGALTGTYGSVTTGYGGLINDSGRHGLYYAHNFSTGNYYLGKLKSSYPQLSPTSINANNQDLSFAHGFALQDKIRKRRTGADADNLFGIFPLSQRFKVFDIGVSIATKPLQGEQFGKALDLQPDNAKYKDTFNYCNMECIVSKRQYSDRIDFVNLSNWGRAEVFPLRPYKKPNGDTSFEGRASTGALAAYTMFGFQAAYDFVCFDPGKEGAIINCAVPQLY